MTLKAIAEAPAKAIITGEHFVVHGAYALAAAVDRTVRVEVEASERPTVESDRVSTLAGLAPVSKVLDAMTSEYSLKPSVRVRIASGIPAGAGMGSSASTLVALAAAVARFHSLNLARKEIIRLAMIGETEVHGKPSGIDASVCAYGGVILFRKGRTPKPVLFNGARRFLLVYSGQRRSTRSQIDKVSGVKVRYPIFFRELAESIDEISRMAAERLSNDDMAGLGRLLTLNHAVLSRLGVSNERLDGLVENLLEAGCLGAKLTGAGGGGSVIAIPPSGKEKSITVGLNARRIEVFRIRVPVGGVKSWLEQ